MRQEVKQSFRLWFLSFFISLTVLWTGIFMVLAYYRTELKLHPAVEALGGTTAEFTDGSAQQEELSRILSDALYEIVQPVTENPALSPRWVRLFAYGLSQKEAVASWGERRLEAFLRMLFW